jgi:hypothetical protein
MNANGDIGKHRRSVTYPADQEQLPLFQLNGRPDIFVSRHQKIKNMDQIGLLWLVDPCKLCLLPRPRQTLEWHAAPPECEEASSLSELFLIEESFMWLLSNVTAEFNGRKKAPNVDLHHCLSEVVTDSHDECSGRLLLMKRAETSGTFFQSAK